MLRKITGYFKVVDLLSVLTFIFIWLKSSGYYNGQASTIIVVVLWTCLREYVNVNSAKRHLKVVKTGRNGGWWVIFWYLFAGFILFSNFLNPGEYNIPTSELVAGLAFVTGEYIRSKKLKGMQLPGTTDTSPTPTNFIISSCLIFQIFQEKEPSA